MIGLLADENFNQRILHGVERRLGTLDVLLATQIGLTSVPDELVLQTAATLGRVVLTHDQETLVPRAEDRVRKGLTMPGVIFVPWQLPIGRAVNDLEVIIGCATEDDVKDAVTYLPY